MIIAILILLGYLIGSIPAALIVSKYRGGIDIREHGDKNQGASNTFRVLGTRPAVTVLALDMLKGIIAVHLPYIFQLHEEQFYSLLLLQLLLGFSAVIGHQFSLFTKFKGGMGVSTMLGVLIAIKPLMVLSFGLAFLLLFSLLENPND